MKIGMVCYPTFGGSGIVASELGHELAKLGHEIHFISYDIPARLNQFQKNIYFHDVEIPRYPLFEFQLYSLALSGKIIDVAKYEKIDLLHVHYAIPHAISGILARDIMPDSSFKVVTTLHGTDVTLVGMEPTFLPIVKYSLDKSDGITAVSEFLRAKTVQNFDISKKIEVIPNFVNTNEYQRKALPELKHQFAPNDEKIIIHISNFRPVKRVLDVVKIFDSIHKVIPSKLILVGDGPDRHNAEELCRNLGLCKDVRFLGKMTNFIELLSISDLFLLPSQSESFGLAALEAMACGTPVIGSNIGGIPELVVHDEAGYVAEFGDTDRMSRYAVELLSNPKKWLSFSQKSRHIAVSKFNSDFVVQQYLDLYHKVLT